MNLIQFILCASWSLPLTVSAFSAASPPSQAFAEGISSFFSGINLPGAKEREAQLRRKSLKAELLNICQDKSTTRADIERVIEELRELKEIKNTATSEMLQKEWLLLWTTEKEINVFSDFGISGDITQTIQSGSIRNVIPFLKGGSFSVDGSVAPDETNGERTNFKFQSATLDLQWVEFSIPPLGEGWFDSIYLDEDLRVDINSRDDILICTCQ
jgi:hypothetical protein